MDLALKSGPTVEFHVLNLKNPVGSVPGLLLVGFSHWKPSDRSIDL